MPQRKSGITELRKNRKARMHNLDIKTDLKKTTKRFLASVEQKNAADAKKNLSTLFKKLDKAAKRHIMEKNTVARRKSRYARQLTSIA